MAYLFTRCDPMPDGGMAIPRWAVLRWKRQIDTDYSDLPGDEKKSDLAEADKMLGIIVDALLPSNIPRDRSETTRPEHDPMKEEKMSEKTLENTTVSQAKQNVSDLDVVGDGDTFKLLCKAYSKREGWMKSTKAMQIDGVGCVVQVTTQQGDQVAEALVFVPGVVIAASDDGDGGRRLRKA